ncbi:TPA: hypothetical protein DCW61_04635 [Candidatus Uhrbacteria bacterium]|nr:hypothetical protein [Candidatus Uhrbacteria bacterium]
MNLRAETVLYPKEIESSQTEYRQGRRGKEQIYPIQAKSYDIKPRDSRIKLSAAESVRTQLETNPNIKILIQKIEKEIEDLKKEPKINITKFKLAQAKLERARQIQDENEKRATTLRLVSTQYEKRWTPSTLKVQDPRRQTEMSALSERAADIYEQQIEREKQELEQVKEALTQAEKEKAFFWKIWSLKAKIRKLKNTLNDHVQLLEMKRRIDEQKKEGEQKLQKTG